MLSKAGDLEKKIKRGGHPYKVEEGVSSRGGCSNLLQTTNSLQDIAVSRILHSDWCGGFLAYTQEQNFCQAYDFHKKLEGCWYFHNKV